MINKKVLLIFVMFYSSSISNEINNLLNDTNHIDTVLRIGSEKAKNIATPIVESAYEIVGLLSTKK